MTHEGLKRRIRSTEVMKLLQMKPSNFAMLTDNFCEELVRFVLVQAQTNDGQRRMIDVIKAKIGAWRTEIGDMGWSTPFGRKYPIYMDELDFKIDLGDIIGGEQEVTIIEDDSDDKAKKLIPAPMPNPITEKLEKKDTKILELEASNKKLDAQLQQVTAENQQLKEQITNRDDSLLEPMDEVQELNLHQKIVFFNTVTSVMLNKRYTNLSKYASFILRHLN